MILSLKIKNFLSFKDEATFSFEATKDKHLEEYQVVEVAPGIRITRIGIVFGANASGKSNLIYAFETLQKFWFKTTNSKDTDTGAIPFLLDDKTSVEPSEFTLTFYIGSKKFVYRLKMTDTIVFNEMLDYYSTIRPATVFQRIYKNNISEIRFNPKLKLNSAALNEISVKCLANMSVFAAYNQVNVHLEEMDNVLDWMKTKIMQTIEPNTRLNEYAKKQIVADENAKNYILDLLNQADYNINNIDILFKEEPLQEDAIINILKSGKISEKEKERIEKERTMKVSEITFSHKVIKENGSTGLYNLPGSLQSHGTMRTMGLASVINKIIERDAFIAIDEVESSLHPKLVEFLLVSFLEKSSSAQMLLTTHNDSLLEAEDILRADNIWFTRKQKNGATELYPLSDFKGLSRISSLQKAYRYGKFGAVPNI
ncbi:MAG: ATP-binding protein [Bacteroidota bacterium]